MHSKTNYMKQYYRALSIAGSDTSGGAGIQADLKTFSALGCYGMTAITAVVDENTVGVNGVYPIPDSFVRGQIISCIDDIGVDAVKIGMLHGSDLIRTVADTLEPYHLKNIVLDPVMVATSGHTLMQAEAIDALKSVLIPMARIITPNIPEAERLLGCKLNGKDSLPDAAKELSQAGKVSVLLKGGHLTEDTLIDVLYNAEEDTTLILESKRVDTPNTHGTGCTLSSAIASFLARGFSLNDATTSAKDYISNAIWAGGSYKIGHGHGPVMHFYQQWEKGLQK